MANPRPLGADELDLMVEAGRAMHAESSYSPMQYSAGRVRKFLRELIEADQFVRVYEADGKVVGGMVGVVMPAWFSDDLCAYDVALYVNRDRRGGRAAILLVRDFVCWAKARGAKQIRPGVTTGVSGSAGAKLYRAMGFEEVGACFVMNVEKSDVLRG